MAPACLLALDLGTTTCRCLAIDSDGQVVAEIAQEVSAQHPEPGFATVHADAWWSAVCHVLRAVTGRLTEIGARPLGLGLAGLQHAIIPVDDEGHVLAPSMLWMDQRCRDEVRWLNTEGREVLEAVLGPGARTSTTPSLPKLRWMSTHQPALLASARHLLLPKDFIRYRLTGEIATDPFDAGGSQLYSPETGDWSPHLVDLAGIRRNQLPPIRPPETLAGHVTPAATNLTGLPEGLPVVIGSGDVHATVLGTGGDRPERALIYMGTAAWVRRPRGNSRRRVLATATTGAALRWLRDLLAGPDGSLTYDEMMAEAAHIEAGSEGIIFLPHLCGERGPYADPDARGTLTGLSLRHDRGHLARAVLEGTCCHLRWLLDDDTAQAPQEIWAAGGAAHSALWMQILANILDNKVRTPLVTEAGALGAAILAAVGIGLYPDIARAMDAMVHQGSLYSPEPALQPAYMQVYAAWRAAEDRWAQREAT